MPFLSLALSINAHAMSAAPAAVPTYLILEINRGLPLQYSCLENPMDGGAWWAAVHGVAKSLTD